MPYMKKGKCVYKKNQDGSQGKKVGCTEGSVDDYLKALYANADGETKKENKTMKIKKSELLALIKEEIMSEMHGLTIMDDPTDDDDEMDMMEEGFENITPENMQLVADALQKMAPMIGAMSLPVLIGMIYEKLKEMGAK